MSKAFVCSQRATLVYTAIAMAFAVLLGRLVYLQVWDHADWLEQIESSRRMVKVVKARRGNVVDCQGQSTGDDPHHGQRGG
jgi:cell division protein FtsI/penicillin-binding protein 2